MNCDWNFRLNGTPVSSMIIRLNQFKRGWPTKKASLTVIDPLLGEITIDDNQVRDIYGDSCPGFVLECRPKALSVEDKSWLVNAGWRKISVENAIRMLTNRSYTKLNQR